MVAPPLSIERHPFIVVRHGDGAGSAEQLKKSGKASEPFQSAWHSNKKATTRAAPQPTRGGHIGIQLYNAVACAHAGSARTIHCV